MSGFRLATGGRALDRSRPVNASVDGRPLHGFHGDTLASALLASGRTVVGRSFKYHRPRGIIGKGRDEPNALFDIGEGKARSPNVQATMIALAEQLVASSVNAWPSVDFDLGAINGWFARFLPAGFYYKTFLWPRWSLFEPFIRRMAGLGRLGSGEDPERYEVIHRQVDVLVIGAGVHGRSQARCAADEGRSVMLIDDRYPAEAADGVQCLFGTCAFAIHEDGYVLAIEKGRVQWRIRAGRIILATGLSERPLLFPGNDRPGVMLASSVSHHLDEYAVLPGKQILIATNGDQTDDLARQLFEAGHPAVAIVDQQRGEQIVKLCYGRNGITGVRVAAEGRTRHIACDSIAMSGGFTPNVQLLMQAGGKLSPRSSDGALEYGSLPSNIVVAIPPVKSDAAMRPNPVRREKQFVDFQNDVTVADIALAAREGFVSVEHLKRYTTLGMATDQGRTSNVNAIAVMASEIGKSPVDVGTTRYRPPLAPVPFGLLAPARRGLSLAPLRFLPAHEHQVDDGGLFEDFGSWYRPNCFPRAGESPSQAVLREAAMVRAACGVMDASPLGKIEIKGPDAAAFLDRIYLQTMSSLKPGRIRYGLMLNELGVVVDDGVVTRLDEDHFMVGTTSAGIARAMRDIEDWLQGDWPELDVLASNVTTSWGVVTLTGPTAREVLLRIGTDIDLDREAFPHLAYREGRVARWNARVSRVSFTGELSYEIAVPADNVADLWVAARAAGAEPFGLDALGTLRLEKGYLHVGSDTDAATLPGDLGFGAIATRKKVDFIGKRSLFLPDSLRADRFHLVGLEPLGDGVLPIGAQVVPDGPSASRMTSDGFVTSSMMSPALRRGVALALILGGQARLGEIVTLEDLGRRTKARIAPVCAFDVEGQALHV